MRFKNQDTLISLRLPKEVDAKIDYLADQKWSDKSSIYREAIRDYLKKDEVSAIDIMISSEEKNKIFIKRSTGFGGSLLMMSVDVNGASAGEIGMNEILVAKIESGKNQVNISWGSFIKSVQIENTGEKNYFFNVMKKSTFFGGLLILELTQESWRNLVD